MQGDQTKPKIFLSRNQFVKCKQFNPIFIIALKAGISSSLHTIILRKQTQTKHPIEFDFILCIFFLSLGLDTSKQSQSILTLIVLTIVSSVLGTFSEQQQGAFESVLLEHFLLRKTVRTPRTDQAQTKNYLSAIGTDFPTPSHTT